MSSPWDAAKDCVPTTLLGCRSCENAARPCGNLVLSSCCFFLEADQIIFTAVGNHATLVEKEALGPLLRSRRAAGASLRLGAQTSAALVSTSPRPSPDHISQQRKQTAGNYTVCQDHGGNAHSDAPGCEGAEQRTSVKVSLRVAPGPGRPALKRGGAGRVPETVGCHGGQGSL